jgi:magnesium transporter
MSLPIPDRPTDRAAMVRACVHYRDGQKVADLPLAAISDVLEQPDGGFVWVALHAPDAELLREVQEEFGLHPLAVEDALKAHQRPKVEAYGEALFLVLHTAQSTDCRIALGETHIFLGPRYLLTVRHGASLPYASARERAEQNPELLRAGGAAFGLYAVLDYAVDNYFPIVEQHRAALEALEKDLFDGDFKRDHVRRLYELKRDLTRLRLSVSPLGDMLAHLLRTPTPLIGEVVHPYLRDVFDHVVRVNEAIDTMREMLGAALSVNLALATAQQGEVVKRLAGWAALLAVPTLIASWYGMNFEHMPELGGTYSYFILMGVVALIAGLLFRVLRRARWI